MQLQKDLIYICIEISINYKLTCILFAHNSLFMCLQKHKFRWEKIELKAGNPRQ